MIYYIYISETYKSNLKSDSSMAKFTYNLNHCFGKIIYFLKVSDCDCNGDKCLCYGVHLAVINPIAIKSVIRMDDTQYDIQVPHIYEYENTNHIILVHATDLETPCILISNYSKLYVAEPINKYEIE